jgi:hypothetical protein
MQLSLSHLGYLPQSPKTVTLIPEGDDELPEQVPFYLRQNCVRMERDRPEEPGFSRRFPSPYDLLRGKLTLRDPPSIAIYTGMLEERQTRWGKFWQADFTPFATPGSYQIETGFQVSPPFAIRERVYDRIIAGYLTFLHAQRCGDAVFGIHDACHLDDGALDRDGSPWPATGGWHDAGDFRKWLAFTLHHLDALSMMCEAIGKDLEQGGLSLGGLLDEASWGNRFFHRMIAADGQVYEDVAGGRAPSGTSLSYECDWWFENHPGCFADASDNRWTDNRPHSGDERMVRTTYNPLVQWTFVHTQARISRHLPAPESARCLQVARQAAEFARRHGHDGRTLFISAELRGHLELLGAGDTSTDQSVIPGLTRSLLERQATTKLGLSGYFMEANDSDGYRSIAFSAEPALTLLRLWEMRDLIADTSLAEIAHHSVTAFVEQYLLADSQSNPFSITPYGVYSKPLHPGRQSFRDAGAGRSVRTFIHPYNRQGIVHGTSSVLMAHAHLMAKAGSLFARPDWREAAERLLHWCLGHNPLNRSLFSGIGYRQPVGYSFRIPQLPEAMFTGFIGRPDDTPYLEESTAIEWNTLEYWSMPFIHATHAACWLRDWIRK